MFGSFLSPVGPLWWYIFVSMEVHGRLMQTYCFIFTNYTQKECVLLSLSRGRCPMAAVHLQWRHSPWTVDWHTCWDDGVDLSCWPCCDVLVLVFVSLAVLSRLSALPTRPDGVYGVVWRCIHFGGGDPGSVDVFAQHSQNVECRPCCTFSILWSIKKSTILYTLTLISLNVTIWL